MNTKIFTKNELSEAAAMIRNGGIVVMPTETVYGLAANAFDAKAVQKVFEAKGRQADNPLIVHIANNRDWEKIVKEIPPKARQLADRFWPGPLTIILKKKSIIPDIVSGGLDTVAVRMPKNKIAFRFIRECGCPLAAPSANLSGCPSPTKFSHVMKDMNGRVDGIIEGGDCMVGVESTVISLVDDKPIILRPGRITAAQISKVIGEVEIHKAVTGVLEENEEATSPGMKYKHYAPKATVTIVEGNNSEYIDFVKENADDKTAVICFSEMIEQLSDYNIFPLGARDDSVAQAKKLFEILRAVDDASLEKAFAPMPSTEGVGLAVTNRLLRASGFNVVNKNTKLPAQTQKVSNDVAAQKEESTKEEKPAFNTKKAVRDSKPVVKQKSFVKKAENVDDDVVEVIGLNNNVITADNDENTDAFTSANEQKEKTDDTKKQNKKPQKDSKQTAVSKEEPDNKTVQPVPNKAETPIKKQDESFKILNEKLPAEKPPAEDDTLQALNEITLSADFNDDFSKEISENIVVFNPIYEPDMPVQIFQADELDEETLNELRFDEAPFKEKKEEEKKPKKHFLKNIFAKHSNSAEKNEDDEKKD